MSDRRRKKVTYRPSKAQASFGGIIGIIFVLIGVFVAIPVAGAFGILWTLIAVGITGMNFYQAFGKSYTGPEILIEEEASSSPMEEEHSASSIEPSPQKRLEQLEHLKESGLITEEEYKSKREEILKTL